MKIFFPENWMQKIIPFIDQDNDFTLVGSISQVDRARGEDLGKMILYNWDHYAFIDMVNRGEWVRFHQACKASLEVWMPSHAHASYFRRDTGVDAKVINLACVDPAEWTGDREDGGYALMSSRRDFYKRFDMFHQACEELEIPHQMTHPKTTSREAYIASMRNCRFYVQASLDESLGGLSFMEAVWNRKPVLMSDSIAGGREIYGDTIEYFRWDDYRDFKSKLALMYSNYRPIAGARERIELQTPEGVARKINRRICELRSTSRPPGQ